MVLRVLSSVDRTQSSLAAEKEQLEDKLAEASKHGASAAKLGMSLRKTSNSVADDVQKLSSENDHLKQSLDIKGDASSYA